MTHSEDTLRWALDKDTQNLVSILNVKNGLACNCICPVCKTELIAHQGENVTHHFKHKYTANCHHAGETALHLKAKEIIEKYKIIKLPSLVLSDKTNTIEPITISKQKTYKLDDEIITEQRDGSIIPDMIVSYKGNKLLIGIAVTSFIKHKKRKIIKDKNISCLEINLSDIYKSKENITDKLLFENIIERIDNKEWIYNKKYTDLEKVFKQKIEEKKKLNDLKEKQQKDEYNQIIKNKVNEFLDHNPSILITDSIYYQSTSNRVPFEIHGELHSYVILGKNKLPYRPLDFTITFDVDTDFGTIDSIWSTIQNVDIKNAAFNRLLEKEIQRMSHNKVYSWLSKNSTRFSRH